MLRVFFFSPRILHRLLDGDQASILPDFALGCLPGQAFCRFGFGSWMIARELV